MKTWLKWMLGIFAYLAVGGFLTWLISTIVSSYWPCSIGQNCFWQWFSLFGVAGILFLGGIFYLLSKVKKYWLKGALMGFVLAIIIWELGFFEVINLGSFPGYGAGIILLPFIGALIGWLVGKLKKKTL